MPSAKTLSSRWFANNLVAQSSEKFPWQTLEDISVRILIALIAVATLSFLNQGFTERSAEAASSSSISTYNCGTPSMQPRCYATVSWPGTVEGSQTSIFTNQIYGGDCFLQNTMWLADESGSSDYWVEAGIRATNGVENGQDTLFWGDFRPHWGFAAHYSTPLTSNDHGKYANVQITRGSTSGTWTVSITGLPDTSLAGTSTSNFVTANDIDIGMEVCGSTGASAPKNGFTNNQWLGSGSWHYQSKYVAPNPQDFPANGQWTQNPNPQNGGIWTTYTS